MSNNFLYEHEQYRRKRCYFVGLQVRSYLQTLQSNLFFDRQQERYAQE